MAPSITVIVCAYTLERWDRLSAAVRSIRAQAPPPAEVVLVIDHNADLFGQARRELSGVTVLENRGRKGLSGARNTGLEAATGDIAVFLDDDAEANPGWLAGLVEPYRQDDVVATGGRVVPVWETRRPRWLPDEFDWVVGCSYRGLPTTEADVRNPIGCSMSVRRQAAIDAGGFRSDVGRVGGLLAGCEETELAIRLRRLLPGSRVVYVPASTVRHHLPPGRTRWRYFRDRCYQEGRSKAVLARLEGAAAGLASERSYTTRVLTAGVARDVGELLHGDPGGGLRAVAIVAGLGITTLGYVVGRLEQRGRTIDPGVDVGRLTSP